LRSFVMRFKDEEGQAIIIVALAMSTFLILAIGLAVDGSNLYTQRQMAQTAADAAAQAGIMSIFDATNSISGNTAGFTAGGTGFTCTTTDQRTPCVYASKNGFGSSAIDTVAVSFPADTAFPGVAFSSDPVHVITVSVSRNVNTTLMRMFPLSPSATTVTATATAGIVSVISPTPLIITHPSLAASLYLNGNTDTIKICGGPTRSIQVNSIDPGAFSKGQGNVDLSQAGPADPGNCTITTGGADFAVTGGPASDPGVNFGTAVTGRYISGASPIPDPLANVAAPTTTGLSPSTTHTITSPTHGCNSTCTEYTPGLMPSLIPGGANVIFDPGVYYVQGGGVSFQLTKGGGGPPAYNAMCVGCPADANTGTGMVVYDTVAAGTGAYPGNTNRPTGGFSITTGVNLNIQGANKTIVNPIGTGGCTNTATCTVPTGPFYGVLFWEDRTANAHILPNNQHKLGSGSGCFTLIGTIYITNTLNIMTSSGGNQYQSVEYNGTPCSTTTQLGEIIVGQLRIKGTTTLQMQLFPYGYLVVSKVALIN
jgi:Flp pilus assembly protein TadG